jgi:hypothetical protein
LDSDSFSNGKRYGLLLLCAVVLPLTLLAGFNFIIDPYQLLGAPAIDGVNSRKTLLFNKLGLTKPYNFYASDYTSLILGSSRAALAIDPAHPSLAGARFYNYAIPGSRPRQDYEKLRAAIATRPIHRVIYCVDFFTFNSFVGMPPDYILEFSNRLSRHRPLWSNPSFLQQVLKDYGTALWSYAALRDSVITLQGQRAAESETLFYTDLFANGLTRIDYGRAQSQAGLFEGVERGYLQSNWFPPESRRFSLSRTHTDKDSPFDDFAALLRLAHDNNIELTVVILPVHARLLEMLDYAGLWPYFEYWKQQLVARNEETASTLDRAAFPIWDFNGYYPVATEPVSTDINAKRLQWMYDSAHTSVNTGNRILDIIAGRTPADFGGTLSSENIDDWLLSQRQLREEFRLEHPLLAKSLKNRVHDVRKKSPWTLFPVPASELKIDKFADPEHTDQRAGE